MKRLVLASCAALLVLAPVMALAQNRPGGGGTTVGSASPRGGESGGSSSTSSSSGGGASERPGGMGSSSGGGSFGSPASGAGSMRSYDGPRSGEPTMGARPRNASASVGQPVPVSERARGDRPVYGQAVPRGTQATKPNAVVVGTYNPYYNGSYGYLYPYYGSYGWYGSYGYYGSPYSWDTWGMPLYGWGMYALPMSASSGYWYDSAVGAGYTTASTGSVKLKVRPKEAEVYVDGTYYGQVDNYDGAFQHLDLSAGTHRVEIRANGFQTLQLEMRVLPGKTITYTGGMTPAK